ncbi:esterase [Segetibacter sp. 3557_3]|uniref:alpha/beta hydrolase-fold protein n=1 Tax=Segetibacter sp. 3557_3 TaxID=2547429 RepID=UPI001058BA7E|nr:alpha/beta hydrolase-fold protein [Segetibacter sp. 3557_3]TDH23487.1 esterase [Segetibacter sp. 3557_3]
MTQQSFLPLLLIVSCLFLSNKGNTQVPVGAKPAPTNIRSNDCPCIFDDNRVLFRVAAPHAMKVQIALDKVYNMLKDDKGIWTVTTDPQVPGFHYYSLVIDSVRVADPASESFYGTGRMSSAIDVPEAGADFYEIKNVPHGDIRWKNYFSKTMGTWRNVNIYTPPGYDQDSRKSYPVLYIQHGGGEDERGWTVQGKTNNILDNLIAAGKAVSMLVVIANGNVTKPGVAGGYNDEAMALFKEELVGSVIPFIESNFRVKPGVANRAISGLSMGGGQAFYTGLRNTDIFSHVGVFSTGVFGGINRQQSGAAFDPEVAIPGILTNPQSFNSKLKLFYISVGEQDPRIEATKKLIDTFKSKNLKVEFASFPGGHEWQVWRKSLHDFAQRLFK